MAKRHDDAALITLDDPKRAVAQIQTIEEGKQAIAYCDLAVKALRKAKAATPRVNEAAYTGILCQQRTAELVTRGQEVGEIATSKDGTAIREGKKRPRAESAQGLMTLEDLGISRFRLKEWRLLQRYSEKELQKIRDEANDEEGFINRDRLIYNARKASQKARRNAQRATASEGLEIDERIWIGDFRDYADRIPDGSVSLIFTDPPYDRKALELFDDLGRFAAEKLCEGGSMLCYVGQIQIPDALTILREHLRYWWTVCCLHSGGHTVMREYGINNHWKAVLWFVRETRHDETVFVEDVMSGGKEKSAHEWQQAESEASYWIEKLCPEDGLVFDPFLGGGTTAAAAEKLGRSWLGCEIDEDQAAVIQRRLDQ